MEFGVILPVYRRWCDAAAMRAIAQEAEALGFTMLWVADHLVAPTGSLEKVGVERSRFEWMRAEPTPPTRVTPAQYYGGENWFLEAYTLLGYLAAATKRVRIGSNVVPLPYRNPIVQARMLATLDILSEGRLIFGVGSGHVRAESEVLGVPYDERGKMSDEYLEVILTLLSNDKASFHGRYFNFDDVLTLGRPVQRPHPPVYAGGMARASIRRAVKYCQGWLPAAWVTSDELSRGIAYAHEQAARIGRTAPFDVILCYQGRLEEPDERIRGLRTEDWLGLDYELPPNLSAEEMTETLAAYRPLGIERVNVLLFAGANEMYLRQLRTFAERVMPQLA
jgi:probable F420-dependent oxidoreductase